MAMLSEVKLPKETINSESFIKDRLREQAWAWFNERREEVILHIRFLRIIRLEVKLGDLRGLWEEVWGPEFQPELVP